jgi:RNA polymerase sigma-70 factor (ECF subfamily)
MLYEFENQMLEKFTGFPNGEPTDEELMQGLKKGNQLALNLLYRRHVALLRTIVSRVINNDYDVDDVVQDAFCEIWRLASHYEEEKGKALGWIVTLTRRRAIDRLRKKQAYHRAEERLRVEVTHNEEPLQPGADEAAIADDTSEIFKKAIAALPEAQQEAIQLAFYRGLSQREIAARTGTPLGTIKTRLELAIRKLRSAILAMGGAGEWMPARA